MLHGEETLKFDDEEQQELTDNELVVASEEVIKIAFDGLLEKFGNNFLVLKAVKDMVEKSENLNDEFKSTVVEAYEAGRNASLEMFG